MRVKIFGAGSIGSHLGHAFRSRGEEVTLCDVDPAALERTRTDVYPSRYGAWDDGIRLASPSETAGESFDCVVVGTPPDTHLPVALAQLAVAPPRVLLIEKPLCPPDMKGCRTLREAAAAAGTVVLVGYNHRLTRNTILAEEWLAEHPIGEVVTLRASVREHWGGIFRAHPWLAGPSESYLGFTERGGGALCEHSHGINIWQHFARAIGQGRIVEVEAMLDWVDEQSGPRYDRIAQLHVRTEEGLVGTIVQDVVTEPAEKRLRMQGQDGFLEWEVNADPEHDAIRTFVLAGGGEASREPAPSETRIPKTRPDDFRPEADHVARLVRGDLCESPISLEQGLETMLVIEAAVRSSRERRAVRIDHAAGAVG